MNFSYFNHPNKVCMTYLQHMVFSASLGKDLFIASNKAFIHAVFPNLFITSSTDLVKNLDYKMKNAGCINKKKIV
jgi:hypothetical protein